MPEAMKKALRKAIKDAMPEAMKSGEMTQPSPVKLKGCEFADADRFHKGSGRANDFLPGVMYDGCPNHAGA